MQHDQLINLKSYPKNFDVWNRHGQDANHSS